MVEEVLFVAKQNRNLVLFYVVGCLVFAAIGDSTVVKDFNILQKFIARANEKSYGYEFSISLSATGENIEKVYEMMRALIYEKEAKDAKSF